MGGCPRTMIGIIARAFRLVQARARRPPQKHDPGGRRRRAVGRSSRAGRQAWDHARTRRRSKRAGTRTGDRRLLLRGGGSLPLPLRPRRTTTESGSRRRADAQPRRFSEWDGLAPIIPSAAEGRNQTAGEDHRWREEPAKRTRNSTCAARTDSSPTNAPRKHNRHGGRTNEVAPNGLPRKRRGATHGRRKGVENPLKPSPRASPHVGLQRHRVRGVCETLLP